MPSKRSTIITKTYTWTGTNKSGQKISGEINTISINLAKFQLNQEGINYTSLQKKSFLSQTNKITSKDMTLFFRQFSTLINAGIPIIQACEILSESNHSPHFRQLIVNIKHTLEAGKQLAAALKDHLPNFDPLSSHLIQVGEQTGKLDSLLLRIAEMKESSFSLRNKIKQALLYPISIFVIAIMISLGMLVFIVPKFEELFQDFHGQLPTLTLALIHLSHSLKQHFLLIPLLLIGITLFLKHTKFSITFKKQIDLALLHLPIIGTLIKKYLLAKFAHSLATLFYAGIPITDALKMLIQLSENYHYQQAMHQLQSEIVTGQRLHTAMQQNSFFPPMIVQMVKVGEESGSLDDMLAKVAEFYENDLDHVTQQFSQLLEPLIILILGVLIGVLVIALYLPIFKLGTII